MKTFKYLLSILFMAGATLGFTACGDDDSDPASGSTGKDVSAVYTIQVEVSEDMLDVMDLTLHHTYADGRVEDVPLTSTTYSTTIQATQFPTVIGSTLTATAKEEPVAKEKYNLTCKFEASMQAVDSKGNKRGIGAASSVTKQTNGVKSEKLQTWLDSNLPKLNAFNAMYTLTKENGTIVATK